MVQAKRFLANSMADLDASSQFLEVSSCVYLSLALERKKSRQKEENKKEGQREGKRATDPAPC